MGIYVDDQLVYVVNGASLNTNWPLNPGKYNTVVEEWDYCGGATFTPVAVTVTNQTGVRVTAPTNMGGQHSSNACWIGVYCSSVITKLLKNSTRPAKIT